MDNAQFVEWVEKNAARVHEYKLGCDGSNGKCDCIGLIIGAWRMAGNQWPWTHGSNYTARYLITGLGKNQPLRLGDLVFKGKQPGDSGYALPVKYKDSGDLTDYYHVGVEFHNEQSRHVRLYTKWDTTAPLQQIIELLNGFEKVNVRLIDNKIIAE